MELLKHQKEREIFEKQFAVSTFKLMLSMLGKMFCRQYCDFFFFLRK